MPLADIANVDIDPKGVFKYILIQVTDTASNEKKHIVRGYYQCTFHDDILQLTKKSAPAGLKLKCVGGGRIKHDEAAKDILVYGYSQGYGRADHSVAVALLKQHYADYHVDFSNDGY